MYETNWAKNHCTALGRAIPYVIDVDPALLRNVETVLEGVNIAYYSVHKGGDLGSYKVEKIGMDCYHMICNTPYDHTSRPRDISIVY